MPIRIESAVVIHPGGSQGTFETIENPCEGVITIMHHTKEPILEVDLDEAGIKTRTPTVFVGTGNDSAPPVRLMIEGKAKIVIRSPGQYVRIFSEDKLCGQEGSSTQFTCLPPERKT